MVSLAVQTCCKPLRAHFPSGASGRQVWVSVLHTVRQQISRTDDAALLLLMAAVMAKLVLGKLDRT